MTDINAEQLVEVLNRIIGHSSPVALRDHLRQVVNALNGTGLIFINGPCADEVLHADRRVRCQADVIPDPEIIVGDVCGLCTITRAGPWGPPEVECTERCRPHQCEVMSRFVVSRSDGDRSFGYDGKEEACAQHLAVVAAAMVAGDERVQAMVTIRWDL